MSGYEVEVRNVDGAVTALGAAGPFTLVIDRPAEAVRYVDEVAEIPNSLRFATRVELTSATVT